jgi:predicted nucleic acid-binding protein
MILVDTSVWIGHFRHENKPLASLLVTGQVACHEFVIGELACGQLRQRSEILYYLSNLPRATVARHEDALDLMQQRHLVGAGLGWVDVHLLASAVIDGLRLWTVDAALATAAKKIGVDHRR